MTPLTNALKKPMIDDGNDRYGHAVNDDEDDDYDDYFSCLLLAIHGDAACSSRRVAGLSTSRAWHNARVPASAESRPTQQRSLDLPQPRSSETTWVLPKSCAYDGP